MRLLNWMFYQTDLQRQLQQSQADADRLQQQLNDKDGELKNLQQDLQEQTTENNKLQHENSSKFTYRLIHSVCNRGKPIA